MMRITGGMVNSVRGNFKQMYRKKNLPITCQSCNRIRDENEADNSDETPVDTQKHLLEECEAFENLRNEFDLETDAGLVGFFKELVKRRIDEGFE